MRIGEVYLENYLNIQEGTGRSELHIDFKPAYDAGLARILFFGRNGSGKTTLVNALTPAPGQMDDRSALIIPGRAGRKTIDFISPTGRTFKCDIQHSSKGKVACFMYTDESDKPTKLTEKGNIGTYMDELKDTMGFTPDFLKIGRIGSSVSGFLDMSPGKRKEYIGQFMPEVEEWIAMNRNVTKRITIMRNQLSGMQVELDRIEPRDTLEATVRLAVSENARHREIISRIDGRLGEARGTLAELTPARAALLERAGIADDPASFNPIADEHAKAVQAQSRAEASISKLVDERPRLSAFTDPAAALTKSNELRENIARANGELEIHRSTRSSARMRLDTAINAEVQANLAVRKATSSATELTTLRARVAPLEAAIAELTAKAATLPGAPDGLDFAEVKVVSDMMGNLQGEINDLRNGFPTADTLSEARRFDMDEAEIRGVQAARRQAARELRTSLDVTRSRITTIETQASFHARFAGMHCNDSRCPFERHISQYATAADELVDKQNEVVALEARIAQADADVADFGHAASTAKLVQAAHARLRRAKPVLEAAGIWASIGPSGAFYDLVASGAIQTADTLSVARLLDSLGVKRDLSENIRQLEGVKERIASMEQLQGAADQLKDTAARATEAVATARAEVTTNDEAVTSAEQRVSTWSQALQLIDQMMALHKTASESRDRSSQLATLAESLEALRARWTAANDELTMGTSDRADAERAANLADQQRNEAALRLQRRDEYEARLAEMQGKIERALPVAAASHPAKGAPIEFLKVFLDTTRENVNDLLDLAMQGEFRIGFSLTDKEFNVPVSKGSGRVIKDITEASMGQLALGKTILSLALVKQTIQQAGGYNIIGLDEIDGMLDREKNRERFADIVEHLSRDLGLEQLFMISHNDSFAASPAGIVLFPGHSMPVGDPTFLENKVVLADFS